MEALKKILGDEGVLVSENELLSYSSDSSKISGKCLCVALPKTASQIQEIVNYARKHNFDIVPRGGGSSLAGGAVPNKSIVLDLSKMSNILEINEEESYVVVEPGIVCDELNERLEKLRCIFPVIPSSSSIATIGGMLATNAAGLWAVKYGKASDWVIEIEVIDGNSYHRKFTKKEDIMNFVGMEGTTGIIIKAKLKIAPIPEKKSLSIFQFYTLQKTIEKFNEVKKSDSLLSLEYIDNIVAKKLGLSDAFYLLAEYDNDSGIIKNQKEIDEFMARRESIGSILTSDGYSIMEDPYVPEKSIPELLRWLNQNGIPAFGHIGIGVMHPRFKAGQEHLINEMFSKVAIMKGTVSGEHGIGLSKIKFISEELKNHVVELKKKYDPLVILNRDKLVLKGEIVHERKQS